MAAPMVEIRNEYFERKTGDNLERKTEEKLCHLKWNFSELSNVAWSRQ